MRGPRQRRSRLGAFRPTPLYLLAAGVFVAHQLAQKLLGWTLPFLDAYLDAFLSIPLLLGLASAERRWLLGPRGWDGFHAIEVAAMTLALALVFEELFPRLDPERQTRDAWDYAVYALGGLAYWWGSRSVDSGTTSPASVSSRRQRRDIG